MVPRKTMEKELKNQEKELTDDINNLNKKVKCPIVPLAPRLSDVICQAKYLEKQFNDAQSQLRDIVRLFILPIIIIVNYIHVQFHHNPKQ